VLLKHRVGNGGCQGGVLAIMRVPTNQCTACTVVVYNVFDSSIEAPALDPSFSFHVRDR
jgi:hypothetical protein